MSAVVPYAPLPLTVTADDGSSDTLVPVGEPAFIEARVFGGRTKNANVKAEKADAVAAQNACSANPAEVVQIELALKDKNGNLVPGANCSEAEPCAVKIEVSGGVLLGIDNGNQADNTSYTSPSRSFYKGQMVVYVRPDTCCNNADESGGNGSLKTCRVTFYPEGKLNPVSIVL